MTPQQPLPAHAQGKVPPVKVDYHLIKFLAMKKGDIITGLLVGFTYIGTEDIYCRVSVKDDKSKIHKGLAGRAEVFTFPAMMSQKGAGAHMTMVYDGKQKVTWKNGEEHEYDVYRDVEFSLV